ncbi:MAG: glycerate kinase [Myxococcota bacterium]
MAHSPLAEDLLQIFREALDASHAGKAVESRLQVSSGAIRAGRRAIALDRVERVGIVAIGKAAPAMAEAVPEPIREKMNFGIILTKHGYTRKVEGFEHREAGHPVPTRDSVRVTDEIVELVSELSEEDLLLVLISGGASALLTSPVADIGLNDTITLTQHMLKSGMDIQDMNVVRAHLSRVKGGRLAVAANPASVLTLALSDVVGDKLPAIGGGPTVADPSRYKDAISALTKVDIWERVPASVREYLEAGNRGEIPESPKPGDPRLGRAFAAVVGGPRTLLRAAARAARTMGLRVRCATKPIEGPVEDLVEKYMARAGSMVRSGTGREVFVAVGEPTVRIDDPDFEIDSENIGTGGRSQHLSLLMAQAMAGDEHMAFLAAGTDGTDGPTDAAGGIVDGTTVQRLAEAGVNLEQTLATYDSYDALGKVGARLQTGPTDTNVTDLHLLAVEGRSNVRKKK